MRTLETHCHAGLARLHEGARRHAAATKALHAATDLAARLGMRLHAFRPGGRHSDSRLRQ